MNVLFPAATLALNLLLGLASTTFCSSSLKAADCTSVNIKLTSQTEVDNFQATHGAGGTCDTVTGYLRVSGDDIVNLSPLSALTRVGRQLSFMNNAALTSLDGLSALTSVGEYFYLVDNAVLADLDGLSSLATIGEEVRFKGNLALTNLDGLSALTRVGGYLSIIGHPALTDLDGLSALTRVGGDIRIGGNDVLTNLDGLSALVSVPGNLNVGDNASLTSLDGLSALTSVGGFFGFINNTALSSFSGLSALTSVGGSLGIMSHPALTNLDGLSALTRVGQDVWIADNAALASCSGLIALLDPVDDSAPGPGPGEAGIPDVANGLVIGGNLPGCNSAAEILATAPLATINAGLSDAWYNPETPGQGFIVIVFPEIEKIFMAWFTYDTERPPTDVTALLGDPGHRWLTALGKYEENMAALDVYVTTGGVFDSHQPEPVTEPDGEIMLEFSTCNAGTISYEISSIDRQGEVPIERITLDNVPQCYLLNSAAAEIATKQ